MLFEIGIILVLAGLGLIGYDQIKEKKKEEKQE